MKCEACQVDILNASFPIMRHKDSVVYVPFQSSPTRMQGMPSCRINKKGQLIY